MQVNHTLNPDKSIQIVIDLDVQDVQCLKHDLPGDQGIVDWFSTGPSFQKVLKCKQRMIKESEKLREKGIDIPADDGDLITLILANEDYKDREARDAVEV